MAPEEPYFVAPVVMEFIVTVLVDVCEREAHAASLLELVLLAPAACLSTRRHSNAAFAEAPHAQFQGQLLTRLMHRMRNHLDREALQANARLAASVSRICSLASERVLQWERAQFGRFLLK